MVCNLIIRNMKEKFTIDGIQFETPNGEDIFLDFCSQEFSKVSDYMTYFKLKEAVIQIDGEHSDLSDNSVELFNLLKHSKLKEVVVYSDEVDFKEFKKCRVDLLQIQTPNGCCFFKTNKCLVH